jgi:hypothetical protein
MLLTVAAAQSNELLSRVRSSECSIEVEKYMERLCSRHALVGFELCATRLRCGASCTSSSRRYCLNRECLYSPLYCICCLIIQISFHNTKTGKIRNTEFVEISERKGWQRSFLKNRRVRKPGLDIHTAMLLGQSTDFLSRDCASILHKLPSYASDTGAYSKNGLKYSNLDQLFKSLSPFELVNI